MVLALGDGSFTRWSVEFLNLQLPYIPPFDWRNLLTFLRQTAISGVELVKDNSYQRRIEMAGVPGRLKVRHDNGGSCLVINVELGNFELLGQAVKRIRRMFDLNAVPNKISNHLSHDASLRALLEQCPGLRLPGSWDGFEVAILAILGQGVTTEARKSTVSSLVSMFGVPLKKPSHDLSFLFPKPEILAVADLSRIGIRDACAGAIREWSLAAAHGQIDFSDSKTIEETFIHLKTVCGMKESMAQYIAMRALGHPDAFPCEEPELKRCLAPGMNQVSPSDALARSERWRPWRSYAAMHLATSAMHQRIDSGT